MSKKYDLSFLGDIKLDALPNAAQTKKAPVVKTPGDDVDIRVFANGRIFPSKIFADGYNLEYQNREVLPDGSFAIKGNGLDIFNSKDWGVIQGKLPDELIFVASVSKTAAKVDIWGSTKYDENNTPKASVFTQGAATYGKNTLVPMLTDIYGIDWENTAYVDLKVADETITSADEIYHIPKRVAAGQNKGKNTYVRREHLEIHPLLVVSEEPVAVKQGDLFDSKEEDAPELVASDQGTDWDKLGKAE